MFEAVHFVPSHRRHNKMRATHMYDYCDGCVFLSPGIPRLSARTYIHTGNVTETILN